MPATPSLAQQLLDAHVAFQLAQLDDDQIAATVTQLVGELLSASGNHQVSDVVDVLAVKDVVRRALTIVPGSAAVSGFVELARDLVRDGPEEKFALGEVVDRDQVERLVDELLALTPLLQKALDQLSASPLVGTMATRFMGRIVGEVVQANKAVADKVPGLGSLFSLGTAAASGLLGAADKQFDGLLGDTVGKSGVYAVGRMNRIVVETLQDPTTREAVLQVWDLLAKEHVVGLGDRVEDGQLDGVADAVHDVVITTLANQHVVALGEAVVDAFFDRFGGYTGPELLDQLDLDTADLTADLVRLAPGVVGSLRESGELERMVRARLAPFYESAEVAALLD